MSHDECSPLEEYIFSIENSSVKIYLSTKVFGVKCTQLMRFELQPVRTHYQNYCPRNCKLSKSDLSRQHSIHLVCVKHQPPELLCKLNQSQDGLRWIRRCLIKLVGLLLISLASPLVRLNSMLNTQLLTYKFECKERESRTVLGVRHRYKNIHIMYLK